MENTMTVLFKSNQYLRLSLRYIYSQTYSSIPFSYRSSVIVQNRTIFHSTKMTSTFEYPVARKDENIVEDHHGTKVYDPYRWLEDPDSAETQAFVEAHNNVTQPYLEGCDQWKIINEKLTKLWNYPKFTLPARHGNYYYYFMNTGLQNQNVLFKQETLSSGEPMVFLDPNTLSSDGTIALSGTSFSHEGHYFAYSLSESGSDWIKIKIRDVNTGKDFDECLERVKYSGVSWTKDDKGFFYSRYDQDGRTDGSETSASENQKLYYHRIGEPQESDVLVVEFPEHPQWRMHTEVSDCGKYLFLSASHSCHTNLFFYVDLEKTGDIRGKTDIVQIIHKFEADYEYITNTGSQVILRTDKGAPNYRLVSIDLEHPEEENWKILVPENKTDVLDWAACVSGNKLVICYIHDVKSALQVCSLDDGHPIQTFPLDIGTIVGFSGKKKYSEIFFNFMSFLTPGKIYRYDFAEPHQSPTLFREINLSLDGFDSDAYAVSQVFYPSKDGTKIPMFIVQKKENIGTPRPCLLYGYGGFNISIQPTFSLTGLMFMDTFNGILAYPNIRGGGEYGEKWHSGGRLFNKQNCFDDFQTAAEYLVDKNYTKKEKIVIQGGSNGGLLVVACINQRPDLFGAAVSQVGVLDMLRFHKFTIGHAWTSDYGNPDEKPHFENLIKISPLHNVRAPSDVENQYPSTLVLTADHDDRVSPLHSLKFMAALHNEVRFCEQQRNPLLLRVYSKAGHGAGKPTTKKIEEATDILTFMYKALNLQIIKD